MAPTSLVEMFPLSVSIAHFMSLQLQSQNSLQHLKMLKSKLFDADFIPISFATVIPVTGTNVYKSFVYKKKKRQVMQFSEFRSNLYS